MRLLCRSFGLSWLVVDLLVEELGLVLVVVFEMLGRVQIRYVFLVKSIDVVGTEDSVLTVLLSGDDVSLRRSEW